MSAFSRIALFIAIAVVACICMVSAAPIERSSQLEAGSSIQLNKRKHHKQEEEEDEDEDDEEEEETTTAATKKKASSSSSSSGSYSGEATYYNTGLGSCGWESAESELIVALNHGQMENGANSNNNPNCGRYINAKGPNGSVKVKVVDTCPGCATGDLDLSPAAFEKIADMAAGRVPVTWTWA